MKRYKVHFIWESLEKNLQGLGILGLTYVATNVSQCKLKQAIKDACIALRKNFFKFAKNIRGLTKEIDAKFLSDKYCIQFSDTHVKFEGFSSSRKANKQKAELGKDSAEHDAFPQS